MTTRKKNLAILALAISASAMAAVPAQAQNPAHNQGDLVLLFQNPGGSQGSDQTVLISLGSAAALRDASSNSLNILNIGTVLADTFGPSWWEQSTLYMSAISAWSSSALSTSLLNGDPTRTLYVSRARTEVGTVGQFGSTPWFLGQDGNMTTGATNMLSVIGTLEQFYTTGVAVSPTSQSNVDNQNPFLAGNQGLAYGIFPGGVQFQFGEDAFGSFGAAGTVEGAIDINRLQARNNLAGQAGFGDPIREGSYEGTITINENGDVSFVAAVPEPSTAALLGASALLAGFMRRRRAQAFPA